MPCSPEGRKAAGIFATAMGLGLMVGPGRHRTDDGEQEKRPRAGLGERGRRAGEEGGGGGASDNVWSIIRGVPTTMTSGRTEDGWNSAAARCWRGVAWRGVLACCAVRARLR